MMLLLLLMLSGATQAAPTKPPEPIEPAGWFTPDDYPAEAIRANVEGTVAVELSVDAAGGVTGCKVAQSSGSELLDTTTCTLLRERGRFKPALDAKKRAVAGTFTRRAVWRLPEAVPFASFVFTAWTTVGDGGRPLSCKATQTNASGVIDVSSDTCSNLLDLTQELTLVATDAKPQTWMVQEWTSVAGQAPLRGVPGLNGLKLYSRITTRFDMTSSGRVNCVVVLKEPTHLVIGDPCAEPEEWGRDSLAAIKAPVSVTKTRTFAVDRLPATPAP
jgi:TonB family protein